MHIRWRWNELFKRERMTATMKVTLLRWDFLHVFWCLITKSQWFQLFPRVDTPTQLIANAHSRFMPKQAYLNTFSDRMLCVVDHHWWYLQAYILQQPVCSPLQSIPRLHWSIKVGDTSEDVETLVSSDLRGHAINDKRLNELQIVSDDRPVSGQCVFLELTTAQIKRFSIVVDQKWVLVPR